MTQQQVSIGVSAQTDQAAGQIRKIETATDDLGGAIDHVAKASQAAADGMRQMEAIAQRLKNVQGVLSKELGHPVDAADAALFLANFENMRQGRGIGSQKTRAFGSFEDWYAGNSTMFKRRSDAERHRRYVMAVGMQRTGYAREYGIPAFGPDETASPPPAAPGFVENTAQRAGGMAMGFGKSMLAMAGLTTIAGMVGSGVDMATEQSTTIDTLKRSMGDLGVTFDALKGQVEDAAKGMGMTTVEAARLAEQFARAEGSGAPNALGGKLKTSIGFARSFGMDDPADAAQFFGTMNRLGVTGRNDQDNRRFALMIAEAIDKSGYAANAADIVNAIQAFASRAAGMTLSAPNVADYASALAGLMGSKAPGLDPAGSAAILNAADNAVRAGGGMGMAGLNFTYGALMRNTPGLDNPVEAEALWQGGMFGSTQGLMAPGTVLGDYMGRHGLTPPMLSGATNFSKLRDALKRQYGDGWFGLESAQNFFGLKSIDQAAALMDMKGADLTGAQSALASAGVKIGDADPTSFQALAKIWGTSNMPDLRKIYSDTMDRSDLSADDKTSLRAAADGGDFKTLRDALIKVVGTHGQEATIGSDTRESIAAFKQGLADLGTQLMTPLNLIREAVQKMAGIAGGALGNAPGPNYTAATNPDGSQTIYQTTLGGRYRPRPVATIPKGQVYLSPAQLQAIDDAAGGDPAKVALMRALVTQENRGFGFANDKAKSTAGARGAWQMMPDTWKKFGDGTDFNAASGNFDAEARAVSKFIDKIESDMGTKDPDVVAAYYNGGVYNAKDVLSGSAPRSKETRDYVAGVDATLGSTPLPASPNSSGSPDDRDRAVQIAGEATIRLVDKDGNNRGETVLRPYAAKPPAGGGKPYSSWWNTSEAWPQ